MIPFRECWACDFEFRADPGERPWPICMVARELHTGQEIRLWRGELAETMRRPLQHRRLMPCSSPISHQPSLVVS